MGHIFSVFQADNLSEEIGLRVDRRVDKSLNTVSLYPIWQYGLWSFQTGGTKLERFLPKNQHTERKLLQFENWCSREVSKSAYIGLSKSIFYVKNHPNLSHFFH